ncbi:pilus assembly protein [Marinobacter sp. C2H3]|uniref:pilus assembly protein n=1 Tax=Marinobacter sp. C2H3 TaxID=3119003 RepID=UPI00300EAB87
MNRPLKLKTVGSTFILCVLSLITQPALADDTEIFFTQNASSVVKPNIMFIIDNSGSMDSSVGDTGKTRMQVVQEVTNQLIDNMKDVNVGLMSFNVDKACYWYNNQCYYYDVTESGGHVMSTPVPVESNRSTLKDLVNSLAPIGNTPLSETLTEAARYFRGDAVGYDDAPISAALSNANTYKSPVNYECQKNHVIFLTDGEPTADNTDASIGNYIGQRCGTQDSNDSNNSCLDEVAGFLATKDINSDKAGDQFVFTNTVGFASQQQLLSDTAKAGNGKYYLADDAATLTKAFSDFYLDVRAQSTTYVAPGIAVNTFDRLNHLDELYYALFQPAKGAIWNGNLKRYKLDIQTDATTGDSKAVIVDVNGNAAIDPTTGFFKDTARSWWSPQADGKQVDQGGAASQLPDVTANRKVYSNLATNTNDLSKAGNQVSTANANLTGAAFGNASMSSADLAKLIKWTRGVDVNDQDGDGSTTDARKFLADPLHSVPHLIIYDPTTTSQDVTIYYGDNQGYIHAVNGATGKAYFSFIPKQLLKNQPALMNSTETSSKVYGMDGTVISWVHDDNFDNKIVGADGDFAYIYSGMRRGGKGYYALDVTDRSAPKLLWSITGGVAGTAYKEMGQTWSKPVKTKVNINNKLYEALIVGGGYDPDQDTATVRTADDQGRAVYIIDASTGALLWWAGPTGSGANLELADLKYSIPASPKVLDVNGDGLADQIYVGDMGGQIFRFDITNTNKATELATGGRIANLASDGTAGGARRFYHSPDLFGIKIGGARYLGLIIGSGYQAHPLSTATNDRMYMLKIASVSSAPLDLTDPDNPVVSYKTITESDLYDATDNLIQQGNASERTAAAESLGASDGWYIRLTNAGEKVLSTSTTVNSEVFITTYEPKPSTNPCVPSTGTSRLYHLSVLDGRAVRNYYTADNKPADELTKDDRPVELNTAGLPANPQRMRVDDTDVVCVGTECRAIDTLKGVVETYWYED